MKGVMIMKFLIFIFILIYTTYLNAQSLPYTFESNTDAKAEEVNTNFDFLANQFKVNKKTIDCSSDNLTKAINDGYNHLVLNGTCRANLLVTPFTAAWRNFSQYGFESNKPTITLTLEGGTNGVFDNTERGLQSSLVYGGILNIIDLTVSQTIYLNNGAKMYVDNSSILEKLSIIDGSSAEVTNSTITCGSDVSTCVYLEDSATIKFDNITVNHAGDDDTIQVNRSSSVEIKNSTITHTGSHSSFLYVTSNSSVQFEDTTVTSANASASVEYNGFLNLNGGSITRNSGTPTVKVKGPGIFIVYNNGSVSDITCEGAFAYINGQANSTTITNTDNATCK